MDVKNLRNTAYVEMGDQVTFSLSLDYKYRLIWPKLIALVLCSIVLIGCSDDKSRSPSASGRLQVVNAISDSRILRIEFDSIVLDTLSYAQATVMKAGTPTEFSMSIQYATSSGMAELIIEDYPVVLVDQRSMRVMLSGSVDDPLVTLIEQEWVLLEEEDARVQFFNGVSSKKRFDVHIVEPTISEVTDVPLTTVAPVASGALYPILPGLHRVLVTEEGDSKVLYDTGPFEVTGGSNELFALIDYFGPGTAPLRMVRVGLGSVTAFIEEKLPAAIRVAQFIPDMPTIDLRVGSSEEAPLISSVPFGLGDYVEIETGSKIVNVTMESSPDDVLFSEPFEIVAGEYRTLVVAGSNYDSSIDGRLTLDSTRRTEGDTYISVVNAARMAGRVDFYISKGNDVSSLTPVFSNLSFLANAPVLGSADTYDIKFHAAGDSTPVVGPETVVLETGIYSVWLTESKGGGEPFQMIYGDDFVN